MTEQKAIWFIFHDNQLLVTKQYQLLTPADVAPLQGQLQYSHKIGRYDEFTLFCAETKTFSDDFIALPMRIALERFESQWYSFVAKAFALVQWDKGHHYCGFCGQTTEQRAQLFERECKHCQHIFYPRISPSVIVLIERDDHILMARGPHFTKGAYGLIAGFIEPGESAEAAVHREVEEEVGITIKNLRYYGSQAWPFPDSLMFGFFANYATGKIIINNELEVAGWYHYKQLPGRPSYRVSIANKMLDTFLHAKR